VVTSPNHPGRAARRGVVLTINPYYEFAVGDLSPRQQTIYYTRRAGQTNIAVTNKGNCETPFRLDAEDDEHKCSFEFRVPGQDTALAKQAEVRVQPDETAPVPILITPLARRLVGFGKHLHSFTLTTTPLAGLQTPRAVLGQVYTAPLLGPWLIALVLLCLALIVVLIFRPTIVRFAGTPGIIEAGDQVTFSWQASQFADLKIEPEVGAVAGAEGTKKFAPKDTTTFKLTAQNWLTRLNPQWFGESREVTIAVEPVLPNIRVFSADKLDVLTGEKVTLSWEVLLADKVSLFTNGVEATLLSTEFTGKREATLPAGRTTFELSAGNRYGNRKVPLYVNVTSPTATPLPLPLIQRFDVRPLVITMGQSVNIDWAVQGVSTVQIAPIPDAFPAGGSIQHAPDKTTAYILTASNGQTETKQIRQVIVMPAPTPTPVPQAPKIEYFTVSPEQVVKGSAEASDVKLNWSVIGDFTKIEISVPDFGKVEQTQRQGSWVYPQAADKAPLFVPTAYNDTANVSAQATLKVLDPTPTPPPTATPPPTPVPPVLVYFRAESGDASSQVTQVEPNRYKVVAGSRVKFSWQVNNVDKVTLTDGGDQPAQGNWTSQAVLQAKTYKLSAKNQGGERDWFIYIDLQPQAQPPAPTNLQGSVGANPPISLAWSYSTLSQSSILGFRLYRGNVPGAGFQVVADEGVLAAAVRSWQDPVSPMCGRVYYIVAAYLDLASNTIKESQPSSNSWSSSACPPTPTPKP